MFCCIVIQIEGLMGRGVARREIRRKVMAAIRDPTCMYFGRDGWTTWLGKDRAMRWPRRQSQEAQQVRVLAPERVCVGMVYQRQTGVRRVE